MFEKPMLRKDLKLLDISQASMLMMLISMVFIMMFTMLLSIIYEGLCTIGFIVSFSMLIIDTIIFIVEMIRHIRLTGSEEWSELLEEADAAYESCRVPLWANNPGMGAPLRGKYMDLHMDRRMDQMTDGHPEETSCGSGRMSRTKPLQGERTGRMEIHSSDRPAERKSGMKHVRGNTDGKPESLKRRSSEFGKSGKSNEQILIAEGGIAVVFQILEINHERKRVRELMDIFDMEDHSHTFRNFLLFQILLLALAYTSDTLYVRSEYTARQEIMLEAFDAMLETFEDDFFGVYSFRYSSSYSLTGYYDSRMSAYVRMAGDTDRAYDEIAYCIYADPGDDISSASESANVILEEMEAVIAESAAGKSDIFTCFLISDDVIEELKEDGYYKTVTAEGVGVVCRYHYDEENDAYFYITMK